MKGKKATTRWKSGIEIEANYGLDLLNISSWAAPMRGPQQPATTDFNLEVLIIILK